MVYTIRLCLWHCYTHNDRHLHIFRSNTRLTFWSTQQIVWRSPKWRELQLSQRKPWGGWLSPPLCENLQEPSNLRSMDVHGHFFWENGIPGFPIGYDNPLDIFEYPTKIIKQLTWVSPSCYKWHQITPSPMPKNMPPRRLVFPRCFFGGVYQGCISCRRASLVASFLSLDFKKAALWPVSVRRAMTVAPLVIRRS